ncbi:hypothetical protein THII_0946 [Thioploca ingrica]|uniref:Uncharacterized protein n=1 Tax=Thioploca ingrica TaxID=40754 RepID=A0A090AC26_9GAMM|nr:hypothetical protein THII_0946 [Thioploca ingrica]
MINNKCRRVVYHELTSMNNPIPNLINEDKVRVNNNNNAPLCNTINTNANRLEKLGSRQMGTVKSDIILN